MRYAPQFRPTQPNTVLIQQIGRRYGARLNFGPRGLGQDPVSMGIAAAQAAAALINSISAVVTKLNGGCGQACTLTSAEANDVETLMKQNLAVWQSIPATGKTPAEQAQFLQNFDQLWGALQAWCLQPQFGDAGVRCITDREPSAMGGDGKFDWFSWYRDPIANDPAVAANAASGNTGATTPAVTAAVTNAISTATSAAVAGGLPSWVGPVGILAILGILAVEVID